MPVNKWHKSYANIFMGTDQIVLEYRPNSILLSVGRTVSIDSIFWYFLDHHLDDMGIVLGIDHSMKVLVLVSLPLLQLNPFSDEYLGFQIIEHEPMVVFSYEVLNNDLRKSLCSKRKIKLEQSLLSWKGPFEVGNTELNWRDLVKLKRPFAVGQILV